MIVFYVTVFFRCMTDFYILIVTCKYFYYIARRRIEVFNKQDIPVPLKTKVLLTWILLVLIMMAVQMASVVVVGFLIPQAGDKDSIIVDIVDFQRFLCFPICDLILSSTITYVAYHQAMTLQREMKDREKDCYLNELEEDLDVENSGEMALSALQGLVNLSDYSQKQSPSQEFIKFKIGSSIKKESDQLDKNQSNGRISINDDIDFSNHSISEFRQFLLSQLKIPSSNKHSELF